MSVPIFFLTLSVLVFVHELGHFLAAKRSGVDVEEFGFGLPPRLLGWKFRGTVYSLNLLPIGGFVKLKGESGEVLGFGSRGSFADASKKNRALIILSGVVGNLLLSLLIFIGLGFFGNPRFAGRVVIESVANNSPAALSGVKTRDVVVGVDGRLVENAAELIDYTNARRGKRLILTVRRGAEKLELAVRPRVKPPVGEGPLGIKLSVDGQIVYDHYPLWYTPIFALKEVGKDLAVTFRGLAVALKTLLAANVPQGLTGVVGIYKLTAEASGIGLRVFLQFVALLSLNLFVFNILPIPALDGGRLLFVAVELIFRRRISVKVEAMINNFGFALLLLIFVLITLLDIKRFGT